MAYKSLTITTEELQSRSDFSKVETITYTTQIPFTRLLTIIRGKLLITNDIFTIDDNPIEGSTAKIWLDGDGVHQPDLSAFDYVNGDYDVDLNVRNILQFEYFDNKSYVFIKNVYP